MVARTWVVLAALLTASVALAGCTNQTPDPNGAPDANAPAPANGAHGASSGGSSGQTSRPAAPPTDFSLTDDGAIQGPFDKSWDISVQNVAFRDAHIHFDLVGLQAGAPPTARITLALMDAEGNTVKTGSLGLGTDSNTLDWGLTLAELSHAGTYTLKATSATSELPLPSGGFASYHLDATVAY